MDYLLLPNPSEYSTYHLIVRTYGSWLLGDEKGSHRHDGAYIPPQPMLKRYMQERCKYPKASFTRRMREIVSYGIDEECNYHHWRLHALNVLSEHSHMLITVPLGTDKSYIRSKTKAAATKYLRNWGYFIDEPVWAKGGVIKPINSDLAFKRTFDYIMYEQ